MTQRDLEGYAGVWPDITWPNGGKFAVSVVINFEEGAELQVGDGDGRSETMGEVISVVPAGKRDQGQEQIFGYGMRAGLWRILDALDESKIKSTIFFCGRAVERVPTLARIVVERGHEPAVHGWRWERHAHMSEPEEREAIARAVAAITEAVGTPPVGWHTRSATSVSTRRLLLEHGGFLYDSNAYNDDLPFFVDVGGAEHLVLPYAFDTNDMRFQRGGGFVFGEDFARYCIDAFDRLYEEGGDAPRMMSVGLHLRIIGRPGRIGGLERFLAHAASKPGVWFARRDAIARHWLAALGKADDEPLS